MCTGNYWSLCYNELFFLGKAIGDKEDSRREMSDAEIITTALAAAMFFGTNLAEIAHSAISH